MNLFHFGHKSSIPFQENSLFKELIISWIYFCLEKIFPAKKKKNSLEQ